MTETERRLYQAWFHHYARGGGRRVGETLADALDEGVDVDAVLDRATFDSESMRARAYNRRRRAFSARR